jgi:hypothetical protein
MNIESAEDSQLTAEECLCDEAYEEASCEGLQADYGEPQTAYRECLNMLSECSFCRIEYMEQNAYDPHGPIQENYDECLEEEAEADAAERSPWGGPAGIGKSTSPGRNKSKSSTSSLELKPAESFPGGETRFLRADEVDALLDDTLDLFALGTFVIDDKEREVTLSIPDDSPAAGLGLYDGDLVVSINGTRVYDEQNLLDVYLSNLDATRYRFVVMRDGKRHSVTFQIE